MGDGAISFEAPELDLGGAGDEPDLEAGAEGAEGADGAEGGTDGEGAPPAEGDGAEPGGKPFRAVENGKLNPAAKATIEKIKAENPQLAKRIQSALFAEDRLRREIPGGFKEVAQLRQTVEQLGGEEGIQSLQGELEGWKEFDAKYTAGDPKVLEFLTETPEAQAAFLQIAPAAFEKFREANPDGYSAYVSQVFAADMAEQQIPMAIQLLGSVLTRATFSDPDKAEAKRLYDSLVGYVNRIGEFAKKPVNSAPPSKGGAGADPRAAELDTREARLLSQEWESETGRQHSRIFTDAWKRLATGVPKDKEGLVRKLYKLHLEDKLASKKDFDANMARFLKAKQKDGFLRLHESTFKDAVPLALRSALAEAGIGARKAPGATPKPGEAPKPGAPPAKPAAGFAPVGQKPNFTTEVDRVRTTPAMWQNRQAILKSGKQVTWQ